MRVRRWPNNRPHVSSPVPELHSTPHKRAAAVFKPLTALSNSREAALHGNPASLPRATDVLFDAFSCSMMLSTVTAEAENVSLTYSGGIRTSMNNASKMADGR